MKKFYKVKDSEIRKVYDCESNKVVGLIVKIREAVDKKLIYGISEGSVKDYGEKWIVIPADYVENGLKESIMYDTLMQAKLSFPV